MEMRQGKSKLILEEIRLRAAKENIVDVEEAQRKFVIFSLLADAYAFNGSEVKEILPLLPVYYVPGCPPFMPGVINVRGTIESVINMNSFLGMPDSTPSPHSRIAIVEAGGVRSGIIVDSVADVVDIPESSVRPTLATLSASISEYVAGEFMNGERNVTILDAGKIFVRLGQ